MFFRSITRQLMEVLDISVVQPGKVLALPVLSDKGFTIFDAGEELTTGHIATLRQWGVKNVTVVSPSVTAAGATSRVTPPVALHTSLIRPQAAVSTPLNQEAKEEQALPRTTPSQWTAEPAGDVMQGARDAVMERFQFLDMEDDLIKALFELAMERQSRLALSRPGKAVSTGAAAPAFQTQRPPKANIHSLLNVSHRMGTLPVLFHRLVEMINAPNVNPETIAKIIAVDPALTARLLRLVNSPFYGLASKVDTISRAVVLVGTRQLVMLAMGATLVTAFKGLPVSLVNMESFWSHSISCGASARLLAKQMRLAQPESFFVAGLLHDIARLLIYTQLPAHALYLLTEARRQQKLVHDLEEDTLGFTHEALGGELLKIWNCPPELTERVMRHHLPVTEHSKVEHVILPAANMLAQALGYGSSGEVRVCPISQLAWQKLGMTPETMLSHCRSLDDDVRGLRAMFVFGGQ